MPARRLPVHTPRLDGEMFRLLNQPVRAARTRLSPSHCLDGVAAVQRLGCSFLNFEPGWSGGLCPPCSPVNASTTCDCPPRRTGRSGRVTSEVEPSASVTITGGALYEVAHHGARGYARVLSLLVQAGDRRCARRRFRRAPYSTAQEGREASRESPGSACSSEVASDDGDVQPRPGRSQQDPDEQGYGGFYSCRRPPTVARSPEPSAAPKGWALSRLMVRNSVYHSRKERRRPPTVLEPERAPIASAKTRNAQRMHGNQIMEMEDGDTICGESPSHASVPPRFFQMAARRFRRARWTRS